MTDATDPTGSCTGDCAPDRTSQAQLAPSAHAARQQLVLRAAGLCCAGRHVSLVGAQGPRGRVVSVRAARRRHAGKRTHHLRAWVCEQDKPSRARMAPLSHGQVPGRAAGRSARRRPSARRRQLAAQCLGPDAFGRAPSSGAARSLYAALAADQCARPGRRVAAIACCAGGNARRCTRAARRTRILTQ